MKYLVRVERPMYFDIEVEADNIPDAREEALRAAKSAPDSEWVDYLEHSVYEVEWTDEDGIHHII